MICLPRLPVHRRDAVCSVALAILAAGLAFPAWAEETAGSEWSFAVTPYVWFASLEGDVASVGGLPPAEIDASFGDIIENTDMTAMVAAEARRGAVGIITDLNFLSLSTSGDTPGPLFAGARVETTTFFATLAGAYRVWSSGDGIDVDALAGARLWHVDTKIDLTAGVAPARSVEDDRLWADPVIGLRAAAPLGRDVTVVGAADVGGFGIASDVTWQVLATLGYRFNDWFSGRVGYRHLAVDFEDDGFVWDVALSGPILGATFSF